MEGGRWTFDMSKKQTLGKKSKQTLVESKREGRRLEEEEDDDNDEDEGEEIFFPRKFMHARGFLFLLSFLFLLLSSSSWLLLLV